MWLRESNIIFKTKPRVVMRIRRLASLVVTHPVQFVAVRRFHLSAAVMFPAVGYASYILAASPATCGHAMDVPVADQVWVSLNGPREMTFVPGA